MKESFSFYRAPITNTVPCREIGAEEVVRYLRSEYARARTETVRQAHGEERRRAKGELLDYVTFSGSFSVRQTGGLVHHSGLMCLDIDHIEESGAERLKTKMAADTALRPLIMFRSPSGEGLKVVVRVANPLLEDTKGDVLNSAQRELYGIISSYVEMQYGVKCDKTHDTARPCYLCHDAEAYYDPGAMTDMEETGRRREEMWMKRRRKTAVGERYGYGSREAAAPRAWKQREYG